MVGPFDPGDDRDGEFLLGVPAPTVEDILLQQLGETLHGGQLKMSPIRAADPLVTAVNGG